MTDNIAGVENAGLENDGRSHRGGNCRSGKWRTGIWRTIMEIYTSQSIAVVTTAPVYLFIERQSRNASKFNRLYLLHF